MNEQFKDKKVLDFAKKLDKAHPNDEWCACGNVLRITNRSAVEAVSYFVKSLPYDELPTILRFDTNKQEVVAHLIKVDSIKTSSYKKFLKQKGLKAVFINGEFKEIKEVIE